MSGERIDAGEGQMTRAQLIRKLLRTLHLNVPERRQLVPPTIDFAELMAAVQEVVEREGRFSSGELGLERMARGQYRIHRLAPEPSAGDMWADSDMVPVTDDYSSTDSAAGAFIRHLLGPTWGSPTATIDGIQILGVPPMVESWRGANSA